DYYCQSYDTIIHVF
nr:immunoglobulin light chain junction region [Macaca mulatta]MOW60650.1 immunoglobulin light chain junction region [Macaca mulatta]